jgi:hypothetical protein
MGNEDESILKLFAQSHYTKTLLDKIDWAALTQISRRSDSERMVSRWTSPLAKAVKKGAYIVYISNKQSSLITSFPDDGGREVL